MTRPEDFIALSEEEVRAYLTANLPHLFPPLVRPTWDQYFLAVARTVSIRSDCERDRVGAVVVKDRRIRATGYNGAPAGTPGCDSCPRRTSSCAPGSSYDNCVAIHAEANALLYCDRSDLIGATIYITRKPCYACSKLIAGAGIERVVTPEDLG
ncbi:deoxycytidylate deaminase [Nocardia cyriacigeorgica]|uniref:deoxycytidylate deaminase n=1 Tax=Nocardia cyriacigeorgica TaxID=135487 RepID=UPI003A5CFDD1